MANEDKQVEWITVDGQPVSTANLRPDIHERAQHNIEQREQAVAAARQDGDRHEEGMQLVQLGEACLNLAQTDRAVACYEQALAIFGEFGEQREEAVCHLT